MRKIFVLGLVLTAPLHAMTLQSFQENSDIAVELSHTNFNRLVVQHDKITQVHFPEGALAVKGETDGSLYVTTLKQTPFTLFVTTEHGHHFSTTVKSVESLGQTIEFVPQKTVVQKKPVVAKQASQNHYETFLQSITSQKKIPGYTLTPIHTNAKSIQQGLLLRPKWIYQGSQFNGEIFELYNGGNQPIALNARWFAENSTKAVKLSEATLMPKKKAFVYRVVEHAHG